jgi:hypothetical protein
MTAPLKPAAGKYGAFIFNGAFPADAASKAIAVKVTNDAFRYYSAATYNAAAPLTKPATQNPGSIHIPESGAASRWRLYDVGKIPNNEWLSAMLWSGADPKRIDLEIQEFPPFDVNSATYTVLSKIVIDYSKVTFYTPAEAASALASALGTGAAASGATVTVSSDLTITANKTVSVFNGVTLTVSAGKTITNNGTITLGAGAKLALATASTTSVGKIAGTGVINAGKTVISGAWEAVGATETAGTLTITSAATGATITADGTNATGLKAGAAGAAITQNAGTNNALTIATVTTINFGGTDTTTPVCKISLTKGTNTGKLTLSAATSVIYTLAAKTDETVYSNSLTSIDTDIVITGISKAEVFQASNKLTKLTGDNDGASITAAASGIGTNDIDSTTATAGT